MRKLFKKRQNIFIRMIHDQAALTLEGWKPSRLTELETAVQPNCSPPRKRKPMKPAAS